ncbi:MAG: L,D-transpeptidase family protein [Deltaproteobacteria bacterium]|nr:L,D-transpeptidase family protein [Candidatus Zymogenaceae bacterium]
MRDISVRNVSLLIKRATLFFVCLAVLCIVSGTVMAQGQQPPRAGSGSDSTLLEPAVGPGGDVVIKNACGAYTEKLGIDLLAAGRRAVTDAGFAVKSELFLPIYRFETFIHYYPGDEAAAESLRRAVGTGTLIEDDTLTPGLLKVILGADAVARLISTTPREPVVYILDATGAENEVSPAVVLSSVLAAADDGEGVYTPVSVNKGMEETTIVYYPMGGGGRAGELVTIVGMGSVRMVAGLSDYFVVLAPDYAGEDWKKLPSWEPTEGEEYSIVIDKSKYILEVRNSANETVCEFPVSIGSNPDLQDKERVGDCRTPEGEFTVENIHDASGWRYEDELAYGPWFIRLVTPPWTGIGIHGTNEEYLIGAPATHGCIRLNPINIDKVRRAVDIGTKVTIVP